jgi:hypothetical protein
MHHTGLCQKVPSSPPGQSINLDKRFCPEYC